MYELDFKKKNDLTSIFQMRNGYLDGLIHPQELYLEMLVRKGKAWSMEMSRQPFGYLVLNSDSTLLEYYTTDMIAEQSKEIFVRSIDGFKIKKILCKSFDNRLLSLCEDLSDSVTEQGVLFREYNPSTTAEFDPDVRIRPGKEEDRAVLWELNDQVWETEDEVAEFIAKQNVFIYEIGNRILGFGIFSPVIPGRPDFDIGMLVAPQFRGQGYGTRIVRHLASHCMSKGWRPICGCDIRNTASWQCLEKSGFRGDHRLLQIELNN